MTEIGSMQRVKRNLKSWKDGRQSNWDKGEQTECNMTSELLCQMLDTYIRRSMMAVAIWRTKSGEVFRISDAEGSIEAESWSINKKKKIPDGPCDFSGDGRCLAWQQSWWMVTFFASRVQLTIGDWRGPRPNNCHGAQPTIVPPSTRNCALL